MESLCKGQCENGIITGREVDTPFVRLKINKRLQRKNMKENIIQQIEFFQTCTTRTCILTVRTEEIVHMKRAHPIENHIHKSTDKHRPEPTSKNT
jgi:hypothetical protein